MITRVIKQPPITMPTIVTPVGKLCGGERVVDGAGVAGGKEAVFVAGCVGEVLLVAGGGGEVVLVACGGVGAGDVDIANLCLQVKREARVNFLAQFRKAEKLW